MSTLLNGGTTSAVLILLEHRKSLLRSCCMIIFQGVVQCVGANSRGVSSFVVAITACIQRVIV